MSEHPRRGRTGIVAARRGGTGRARLVAAGVSLAALGLLAFASPAAALEQTLVVPDGAAGDGFGVSVAIDGNTAVVGAPYDDGYKGAVYVFQRWGDIWAYTAKLTASDGAAEDQLGDSVAIDGDTIVAGAPLDNFRQGSVYTFARTGAAVRTQTAKLIASDGTPEDWLGYSVAIEGDTIVAGAPFDDAGVNVLSGNQGSVYTFARTGAAVRTETAELTASDGGANDELGYSVAIDGGTIVAGAPFHTVGTNFEQGSAYTFARTGAAARTETAKLIASDGAAEDRLAHSVAIDGDTIVAGAAFNDGTNKCQGSAYTFARTGAAARTETAKLIASDGAARDLLGRSVAIDGDTIVAGAPILFSSLIRRCPDNGNGSGSAYTFAGTGAAARTETAKLTASDGAAQDLLGWSAAIDGDAIVIGAPGDDVGANGNQGSATVFSVPPPLDGGGGESGGGGEPSGGSGGGESGEGPLSDQRAPGPPAVKVSSLALSAELPVQCGVPVGLAARLVNDSATDAEAARVELLPGDDVVIESGGASQVVSNGLLPAGALSESHDWVVKQLTPGSRELTITGYAQAPGSAYYLYPHTVELQCERYPSELASRTAEAKRGTIIATGRVKPAKPGTTPGGEVDVVARRMGHDRRVRDTARIRDDRSFTARLEACKPGAWKLHARYLGDTGYLPSGTSWRDKVSMSPQQARACAKRRE